MSGKHRGAQCCAFGCPKRKKQEARSNSEGSSDDNHLSKDSIQGHFTRKFFFVMVFMLGQITIRGRNYMSIPLPKWKYISVQKKTR